MKWENLVRKARKHQIKTKPLVHPWWSEYQARLIVEPNASGSGRNHLRSHALQVAQDIKKRFSGVGRSRIEGGSIGLFAKTPDTISRVIDHVINHQPGYRVTELCCPISEEHVTVTAADFPTVVREKLFQNKFRYRIVSHVGWGYRQDSSRLDAVMDEWERWVEDGLGEISQGARYRWTLKNHGTTGRGDYRWSGIMSFYTDDQQLSFIMQLAYPEFYKKTEKVVLVNELGKEVQDGRNTKKTIEVQALGAGDMVHES